MGWGAVLHPSAVCIAGGTPGKRNRFREALLWNDPPEYFDGRFVAFTADVPANLLKAAVPPDDDSVKWTKEEAAPQFALIHHQYRQACGAPCCVPSSLTLKSGIALFLPRIWSAEVGGWCDPVLVGLPSTTLAMQQCEHIAACRRLRRHCVCAQRAALPADSRRMGHRPDVQQDLGTAGNLDWPRPVLGPTDGGTRAGQQDASALQCAGRPFLGYGVVSLTPARQPFPSSHLLFILPIFSFTKTCKGVDLCLYRLDRATMCSQCPACRRLEVLEGSDTDILQYGLAVRSE